MPISPGIRMSEMYVNRLLLRFTLSVDLDTPLTKGYSTLCTKQQFFDYAIVLSEEFILEFFFEQ